MHKSRLFSARPARRGLIALAALAAGSIVPLTHAAPADAAEIGGARPMLVVLMKGVGKGALGHTQAYYEDLFFGTTAAGSVSGYYKWTSSNQFSFSRAGMPMVQDRDDATLGADLRTHALNLAGEAGFNFAAYDKNGDGTVSTSELTLFGVENTTAGGGAVRGVPCFKPKKAGGGLQAVQICGSMGMAGHLSSFWNFAHESSHMLSPVSEDLYGVWNKECLSQGLTLMACTAGGSDVRSASVNFDPMHRMAYGWGGIGQAPSLAAGATFDAVLNAGPKSNTLQIVRGNGERLLFENRQQTSSIYEKSLSTSGVIAWYFKDDAANATPLYSENIPSLNFPGSTENANFALAPVDCLGDPLNASSRGGIGAYTEGRYRFKWLDGTDTGHTLTVKPKAADGSISVTLARATTAVQCKPDLQVTAVSNPATPTHHGGLLDTTFTVKNTGTFAIAPPSTAYVYLSKDAVKSADDIFIGSGGIAGLVPGASMNKTVTGMTVPATLPPDVLTDYYILVEADGPGSVSEHSETNNVKASATPTFVAF